MIVTPTAMTDDRFAVLQGHFSEGEIVEICFLAGFYNLLHRFNAVIDLSPIAGDDLVVQHLADFQLKADDPET